MCVNLSRDGLRRRTWFGVFGLSLAMTMQVWPASIDTLSSWSGAATATFGDDAGLNAGGTSYGQTFTMPEQGQVTSVAFGIQGYAPYTAPQACTFEALIIGWNGSRPAGTILYQSGPQTMPLGFYPTIDFNLPVNNLLLAGGLQYVLILTSNDFLDGIRSDAAVESVLNDPYPGGTFVSQYPGYSLGDLYNNNWSQAGFLDLAFQVNYTPVPEPSSFLVLVPGALFIRVRPKRS